MSKQLQCLKQGGPFEVVQVPARTPRQGEVLLRMKVIAFNLIDVKQRDRGIGVSSWPRILGIEGAGVVDAVGEGVKDLEVGDEVAGQCGGGPTSEPWNGAYQEHLVVPAFMLAKKPQNISLVDASSLPIAYITAVCSLINALEIPLPYLPFTSTKGQAPASILILGGSSVVGAASIQLLAKAYPTLPIFATSSPKHHARLQSLGVKAVVDYKSPTLVADLIAVTSGGVDVILDCVASGFSQTDIFDALSSKGSKRYAAVITGTTFDAPEGVHKMDASATTLMDMQGGEQVMPYLTTLVENGTFRVPLPVRVVGHGLEALPDVMDEVKSVSGEKVVLTL